MNFSSVSGIIEL